VDRGPGCDADENVLTPFLRVSVLISSRGLHPLRDLALQRQKPLLNGGPQCPILGDLFCHRQGHFVSVLFRSLKPEARVAETSIEGFRRNGPEGAVVAAENIP
jgi:hypothetical protein